MSANTAFLVCMPKLAGRVDVAQLASLVSYKQIGTVPELSCPEALAEGAISLRPSFQGS